MLFIVDGVCTVSVSAEPIVPTVVPAAPASVGFDLKLNHRTPFGAGTTIVLAHPAAQQGGPPPASEAEAEQDAPIVLCQRHHCALDQARVRPSPRGARPRQSKHPEDSWGRSSSSETSTSLALAAHFLESVDNKKLGARRYFLLKERKEY